jgi:hypothetical protein
MTTIDHKPSLKIFYSMSQANITKDLSIKRHMAVFQGISKNVSL